MTPAEKALIDALLTLDERMRSGLDAPRRELHSLKCAVAMERLPPGVLAEFKECLRAKMRAERAYSVFWKKMPSVLMDGTGGITMQLWDEIEKEEGWA